MGGIAERIPSLYPLITLTPPRSGLVCICTHSFVHQRAHISILVAYGYFCHNTGYGRFLRELQLEEGGKVIGLVDSIFFTQFACSGCSHISSVLFVSFYENVELLFFFAGVVRWN